MKAVIRRSKRWIRPAAGIFAALALAALLFFAARAESAESAHYRALLEKGFPVSYAARIAPLCAKHPLWRFEPLFITRLSGGKYTFSYCLDRETETEKRNLAPASAEGCFQAGASYDSGLYPATREAIAFFMDPRNFLNEECVFQFWDLSGTAETECVRRLIAGSFLEKIKFDGKETALFLCEEGEKAGVNAVFSALRLIQEQGAQGNALAGGEGGQALLRWKREKCVRENGKNVLTPEKALSDEELLSLNGYYNYFNIGAAGSGLFAVIQNGLVRAKNEGWDTPEKAMRGGIAYLADEYVKRRQNTVYLQKWNVDPESRAENGGSRNFWGQYMQNILAAEKEGERLGAVLGGENEAFSFLIPVYEGLPEEPCPDPSGGAFSHGGTLFDPEEAGFVFTVESQKDPAPAPVPQKEAPGSVFLPVLIGLFSFAASSVILSLFTRVCAGKSVAKK